MRMHANHIGMFWQEPMKVPKSQQEKRTPPERTWEEPDYLPSIEEARAHVVDSYTDAELLAAQGARERLIVDVESFPNYFLIGFLGVDSHKSVVIEVTGEMCALVESDRQKLKWIFENFCLISFNGNDYDVPIASLAVAGATAGAMKRATTQIIEEDIRPYEVLKKNKARFLRPNHIDLIEIAPGQNSLKIFGGRLHCRRMQDLPFHHNATLNDDQITIVRWYNHNDLEQTLLVYRNTFDQIKLRETLTAEYGLDLRSKSDAQIAEAVIIKQLEFYNGSKPTRPDIDYGRAYRYIPPPFLRYESELMKWVFALVLSTDMTVGASGAIEMPDELKNLVINLGASSYRMGIGGLHSTESAASHYSDETFVLLDRDVVSYYPNIILKTRLFPQHLGANFLVVYNELVDRRLAAKAAKNKPVAESLKIVVNGSFGKLGSPYSSLYAPDLLIQVTLTGQLSLLMLIERIEMAGIAIVSANTDGIVMKVPRDRRSEVDSMISAWEKETGFETEETEYRSIHSRDVNSYIAIKPDGTTKNKGALGNPWASGDVNFDCMRKTPSNQICVDAVEAYLLDGTAPRETIRACVDPRKFITVRKVQGGAVKDGEYLGKAIRYYYASGEEGEIVYARSGNKVPNSDGAKPLMTMSDTMPTDVDYDRYEQEAGALLVALGVSV
jgi:hypothetical protein